MRYERHVREALAIFDGLTVDVDKIGPEEELNGVGVTSLNYIQLIVKLEKTFNIKFGIEDLDFQKMNTIGKIADRLELVLSGDARI